MIVIELVKDMQDVHHFLKGMHEDVIEKKTTTLQVWYNCIILGNE